MVWKMFKWKKQKIIQLNNFVKAQNKSKRLEENISKYQSGYLSVVRLQLILIFFLYYSVCDSLSSRNIIFILKMSLKNNSSKEREKVEAKETLLFLKELKMYCGKGASYVWSSDPYPVPPLDLDLPLPASVV